MENKEQAIRQNRADRIESIYDSINTSALYMNDKEREMLIAMLERKVEQLKALSSK